MKRNLFNWGHTLSTSLKTGEFTPIFSDVVVPNTTVSGKFLFGITADVPLRPIKWDYFFEAVAFVTPRRILCDGYKEFITGAKNGRVLPDDHADAVSPNFTFPALELESPLCHMGYQDGIAFTFAQTTEELRAMALIWNWYVRDQNLQDEIEVPFTSGTDDPSTWWPDYDKASGMLKVCQFKDYFTSAQPTALKGSPVPLPQPLGSMVLDPSLAPTTGQALTINTLTSGSFGWSTRSQTQSMSWGVGQPVYQWNVSSIVEFYRVNAGDSINAAVGTVLGESAVLPIDITVATNATGDWPIVGSAYAQFRVQVTASTATTVTARLYVRLSQSGVDNWTPWAAYNPSTTPVQQTIQPMTQRTSTDSVDLSGVRAVPFNLVGMPLINDLRFAVQTELTKIMDQRRGNRYNEWGESHFDVDFGDKLIQIPQFVSACKQRIRFGQVLQTSAPTDDDPLGQYGGHAQTGDVLRINWHCKEESILQIFAFIRPRPGYQQGAARWRTELTRFERYDTPMAHLGMQAIKGRELCVTSDPEFNESDHGYQDVWDHHRHKPSRVNGLFRSSKSMWTTQRIFDLANPPVLNEDFIEVKSDDSSDRNFAAAGVAPWVVDVECRLKVLAPLPKSGTPGYMDHIRI